MEGNLERWTVKNGRISKEEFKKCNEKEVKIKKHVQCGIHRSSKTPHYREDMERKNLKIRDSFQKKKIHGTVPKNIDKNFNELLTKNISRK